MQIDLKVDGHVHTSLCHHASGTMEDFIRAAIERGLDELIFLEHLELGIHYPHSTWLTEEEFVRYHREGKELQERYQGKIRIGLGVELGYNPERRVELLDFLNRFEWDRIGISYHYYRIGAHHYNVVSRRPENLEALVRHGSERVLADYFAVLLEAILALPGTVLCHLDAVLRYQAGLRFSEANHLQIGQILAAVKEKGMALEVNTAGFGQRGEPYPGKAILTEAVSRGIPLVAGSDAHRPEQVGRDFERLAEWLGT